MNTTITAAQLAQKIGVDINKINTVTPDGIIIPFKKNEQIELNEVPFLLQQNGWVSHVKKKQLGLLILDCFKKHEPAEIAQQRQTLDIKLRKVEAEKEECEARETRLKARLDEFDSKLSQFKTDEEKTQPECLELVGARREVEKQHNEEFKMLLHLQEKVKDVKKAIKELGEAPDLLDGFLEFITNK